MKVLRSRSFALRGARRRDELATCKSFTNTPREYLKKCPECDATLKFKINPQSDGVLWV